jgi:hypothetical protein
MLKSFIWLISMCGVVKKKEFVVLFYFCCVVVCSLAMVCIIRFLKKTELCESTRANSSVALVRAAIEDWFELLSASARLDKSLRQKSKKPTGLTQLKKNL